MAPTVKLLRGVFCLFPSSITLLFDRFYRLRAGDDDDDFAFGLVFGEPGDDFLEGSPVMLLVELGYLAGDGTAALRPEMLDQLPRVLTSR